MILDLSKQFRFRRNENEYEIGYIFKSHKKQDGNRDVCLEINVSVNGSKQKMYEVSKPTFTLFQSNDAIEEMIADEAVAFSGPDNQ